ncbi:MAG: hypothetical protein ACFE8M_11945 [Candidatus Hermodarchaeota archaeon]
MMIQEPIKKKTNLSAVQCRICNNDTKNQSKIVKLGSNYGIICSECSKMFSLEDIDLMYNMFIAFGGYFGKLKDRVTSTYKIITKLIKKYNMDNKDLKATEIDVKVLHKALLYGITPRQLIQGIKLLYE